MNLLLVALAAAALGFVLVLVAARGQPVSPAAAPGPTSRGEDAELGWVRAHGIAGLERLLQRLFEEMGFELGPSERSGETVAFCATDPRPIRGGRVYVHGVMAEPGVRVDGDEVRALADAARAESAGKAIVVTLGGFSDEAREAAKDQPMELVDGAALAELVRKHLPQAHATRAV